MLHVKFVCGLIISGARRGATGASAALLRPTAAEAAGGGVPTAVIVRAVLSSTPRRTVLHAQLTTF